MRFLGIGLQCKPLDRLEVLVCLISSPKSSGSIYDILSSVFTVGDANSAGCLSPFDFGDHPAPTQKHVKEPQSARRRPGILPAMLQGPGPLAASDPEWAQRRS